MLKIMQAYIVSMPSCLIQRRNSEHGLNISLHGRKFRMWILRYHMILVSQVI